MACLFQSSPVTYWLSRNRRETLKAKHKSTSTYCINIPHKTGHTDSICAECSRAARLSQIFLPNAPSAQERCFSPGHFPCPPSSWSLPLELPSVQYRMEPVTPTRSSSALESLHCHNDYKSYIRCSWTESTETHLKAPLTLYHYRSSLREESPCLPYRRPVQLPDGRLAVHCQCNISNFRQGYQDAFFFKTLCPPVLSKTFTPLQHVRLGPPRHLSQRAAEGGGAVLEWQDPLRALRWGPRSPLNYQVGYRRRDKDWMEVEVSELELKIEAESLVPGCQYEAKVRAREDKGLWSEWSPTVVWKTEDAPNPHYGPNPLKDCTAFARANPVQMSQKNCIQSTKHMKVTGPSNLQCVFDGQMDVHCSWEVKRELAEFITYNLSYRLNQTFPAQWCNMSSPPNAQYSRDPVLMFSCSFSVSDPEQQLLVELVPSYNTKVILSHRHVQHPPPDPVQVTERGGEWVLSWTPPVVDVGPSASYELRYWSSETQDSMEYCNFTEGARDFSIYGGSLLPSTHYAAQVRALTIQKNSYMGPPSEWTQLMEWTTHPASWSIAMLMYIFIAVLVAIIFIILYFTLPACRRRIVLWNVSIPTPIKSKVLEEMMKKTPSGNKLALQKENEKPLICSLQVLGNVHPSCFVEDWSHPQVLANGNGQGPCWETAPKPAMLGPPSPPKETSLSFSGPYILCPACSPPEASEADEQACLEDFLFGTPFLSQLLPSSGGYMDVAVLQDGPGKDSAQGPSREGGPIQDGYVAYPMGDPQPKSSPGYNIAPVPFQGGPGEPEGRGVAYPPLAVPGYSAGGEGLGEGLGWPGGQCEVTHYVRLSE
ncbi:hypothetical protein SKAU_G00366840 [Synaphobranchus kaupii]|uniref:Fibronectin type-III domain-containing protein n=1 Tax=Synaphobranchus kaupii TaxID=118154 RepID=A0A9Q1EF80_SYNKA|nr:hypothetical protein SKAU_G00366840 [Synaphobranchus kaupii]